MIEVTVPPSLHPDTVAWLVELFYPELRRIAAARMRVERPDHTLQPTEGTPGL